MKAEGVLWGGPVLELHTRALARLGPDILGSPPDFDGMLARIAAADGGRRLGEILQDQSLVAGIGNMWMAETLWQARSPWLRASRRLGRRPAAGAGGGRSADARSGRGRTRAAQAGARPRGAAVRSLPHAHPGPRPGRRQPHGLLVPELSGRRQRLRLVMPSHGAPRTAPLSIPARFLPRGVRRRARGGAAVRVRGASDAGRAVALRVPPARPRVRRGAGADAAPPPRHAQRDRRPAPRAGGRDLRPCALGGRLDRGRRALSGRS